MWLKAVRCNLLVTCIAIPLVLGGCSLSGQAARPAPAVVSPPAAVAGTSGNPSAVASATIFAGPPVAPGQSQTAGGTVTTGSRSSTATRVGGWGQLFSLSAGQARAVATVMAFLDAYNAGQLEVALALLADDGVLSDCDYRAGETVNLEGKAQFAPWLRERIAERDQLIVAQIANENPDQSGSGAHVVGVVFARRSSDTLRALGNPDGIVPKLAAKVILTSDDRQIAKFANGPYGGSPEDCRRAAGTPTPGRSATPGR